MKKTIKNKLFLGVFLVIEIIIYCLLIIDTLKNDFLEVEFANNMRFIATFVMVLFSVLISTINKETSKILMYACLFFLGADGFLVLTDSLNIGIFFFIIAQIIIQYYINKSLKMSLIHLIVGITTSLTFFIFNSFIDDLAPLMSILALCYVGLSIFNIISLLIKTIKNKSSKHICLLLGLIFLLCCDICLGLSAGLNVILWNNSDWLFYINTLILLVLEQYINVIRE